MPRYTPSDDDMDAESYGAPSATVTPPEEGETPPAEKESVDKEEREAGEETALVSNKILSPEGEPLKEGDEIVVKVVKNYGDESEIMYAPKKEGDETEPETSDVASDFAAMDQEKA